jgi:hypothetical protein
VSGGSLSTNATPAISGTGEAGTTITLYNDANNTVIGSALVNVNGLWQITASSLVDGHYTFTAVDTDSAGNVSNASSPLSVTVDTVPPVVTSVVSLSSASGTAVEGTQLTFVLTTNKAISLTEGSTMPTLTLSDGETATLSSISASGTTLYFTVTVGSGYQTSDLDITGINLNGGSLTDSGGLALDTSSVVNTDTGIAVNSATPNTPSAVMLTEGTDGAAAHDLPTITGRADPGTTITIVDTSTNSIIGTTTVAANGTWKVTTSVLPGGSHVLEAISTNSSGNSSAPSSTVTVLVASSSSSTSSDTFIGLASDTGVSDTDGVTSNATLTGTAAAGSTVTITNGSTVVGTATANASGTWTYTPSLADGSYTLTASGTDAQGNAISTSVSIVLDTAAPTINLPNALSNTSAPTLTGTATAGSTVTVLLNGNAIGTTIATASGTWSLTTTAALSANSIAKLQAVASDTAGVSSSSTTTAIITVGAPVNGVSQSDLTSYQVSAAIGDGYQLQLASGTEAVQFVDGTLSVGVDTQQAYIERLYEGLLGRASDSQGISFWNEQINTGAMTDEQVAQFFLTSAEYQAENAGLSDTQFVISLYQGFLNRSPSAAEIANATTDLADGVSRAQLLTAVTDSAEAKTALAGTTQSVWVADTDAQLVTFIYETALGRTPDTQGLEFWTNELKQGITPTELMHTFTSTPEFVADHGSQTTGALIDALYQNALGRAPTTAELAKITKQFQNGTITTSGLVVQLVQSNATYTHLFKTL